MEKIAPLKERHDALIKCWNNFEDTFLLGKQNFVTTVKSDNVFTNENIEGIKKRFIDAPNTDSSYSFEEKLSWQFNDSTVNEKLLFLHAEFIHLLIISPGGVGVEKKTEQLQRWEEETGPINSFLALIGVSNPGQGYKGAGKYHSICFIVGLFECLLKENFSDKTNKSNLKEFIEKYCSDNEEKNHLYGITSAIRYYIYPDKYEPIISKRNKQKIVDHYTKQEYIKKSISENDTLDEKIHIIRKAIETEDEKKGIERFTFYGERKSEWDTSKKPSHDNNADEVRESDNNDSSQVNNNKSSSIPLNQIFYGPPGTGKTYITIEEALNIIDGKKNHGERSVLRKRFNELKKAGQIEMITFHQNYAYEDFIEGIKPVLDNENISYKMKDGIFKRIATQAGKNKDKNYVLIIDEINRGNISKIFGELITLIEESKRLGKEESLRLTLPYSDEDFGIPDNLYIIGTMNTADRSIALLDTALRRRFTFIEMMPDAKKLENEKYKEVSLPELLTAINKEITKFYDREHQIGHTYFMGIASMEDLKNTFQQKIMPLLQEYFFDDRENIQKVLNDNGFIEKGTFEICPFDDSKWTDPESYTKIYEV